MITRGFFRRLDRIDEIVAKGAGPETALALASATTDFASAIYVMDKLDATWLEPLEVLGFFRGFVPATKDSKGASRSLWPATGYLKKVAKDAQSNSRIAYSLWRILSFMPTPESFHIVRDMVEITILLPLEMRRAIVPVIQRVVSETANINFTNIPRLINKLAEDGEVAPALRLFATVFAFFRQGTNSSDATFSHEPKAFMDSWYYKDALEKCLGTLSSLAGLSFLQCLCRLLDESLRITSHVSHFQGPDDFSYVWRPAIERHAQNIHEDPRDAIVTALRDSAASIVLESPANFSAVVALLDCQQWFIFTRVLLYLLAESPAAPVSLIAQFSTDPYLFSELGVRHEYSLLLRRRFKELRTAQQTAVLKMIEAGPDRRFFEDQIQRTRARPATDDETSTYVLRWQHDWLSFIESDLPDEWAGRFFDLREKFGKPANPDFPYYMTTHFGTLQSDSRAPGSNPHTAEETSLTMLLDTRPYQRDATLVSDDEMVVLLGTVKELDLQDQEAVLNRSDEVSGLPFPILNDILSKLLLTSNAGEGDRSAALLLRLSGSIVARAALNENKGSREVLIEFAMRVVTQLLQNRATHLGNDEQRALVGVVVGLLQMVESLETSQAKRSSEISNPVLDAMNTLKGRIVDVSIQVALLKSPSEIAETYSAEWLLSLLAEIMSRVEESETSITAVLGYRFPWLVKLSPGWAVENASQVFPVSATSRRRRAVAWRSYITYAGAHDDVFEIIRVQYARAIDDLAKKPILHKDFERESVGLAQHLAAYFWRGRLPLQDSLFQKFLHLGDRDAINGLVNTLGRAIRDKSDTPGVTLRALSGFADWMTLKWRPRTRDAKRALSAFGWWFPLERVGDAQWRLRVLQRSAALAGGVQNHEQVLKTLEELAPAFPDLVISCLRTLVINTSSKAPGYDFALRSDVILDKAIKDASSTTRRLISDLADHFGSSGHFQYRRFAS